MPVSSVHILPIKDGLSGPQSIEIYSAQLEALGARKAGTFSVECDTYYSNPGVVMTVPPNSTKVLNVLTSSEYPTTAFSLFENGSTIVTDSSFDLILANLGAFYTAKKLARMEVKGQRWSLNDFIVKIGPCTMGPNFKAVVAEIEYSACCVPSYCWELIKEIAQAFTGLSINQPQQHLIARINEEFHPIDNIHQYNEIFNQLKKII